MTRVRRNAVRWVWAVVLATSLVGCAPEGTEGDSLGQSSDPIAGSACVLTTYDGYNIFRRSCSDGIYFYTSDGNTTNSGGVRTGLEWQCVEWTNRYFHFKWGTPLPWYGNATDKCTNRPSSVSTVSSPWWGDAVVFRPNACLRVSSTGTCASRADPTYGHIGIVVGFPSATTMRVKDQNGAQNPYNDYIRTAVGSYPNPVQCYLRDSHHVCQMGSTRNCTAGTCGGTQTCATGRGWTACAPVMCPDAGSGDAGNPNAEAGAEAGAVDAMPSDAWIDGPWDAARDGGTDAVTDVILVDAGRDAGASGDGGDIGAEDTRLVGGCACAAPGTRSTSQAAGAIGWMVGVCVLAWRRRRKGDRRTTPPTSIRDSGPAILF